MFIGYYCLIVLNHIVKFCAVVALCDISAMITMALADHTVGAVVVVVADEVLVARSPFLMNPLSQRTSVIYRRELFKEILS